MRLRKISKDEWQSIVNDIDLISFFECPMWYSIWEKYLNAQSHAFLIDDHLLLSAIDLKAAKGAIRFLNSSPAGTYSNLRSLKGPIVLNQADFEKIKKLTSINFIRLSPFTNVTFNIKDSIVTKEQTQLCHISTDDSIEHSWSRNHKRMLKVAQQSVVNIAIANNDTEWNDYFSLYHQFAQRNPTAMTNKYTKSLFDYIHLLSDRHMKLWIAKKDDLVVAGRLVFYTRDYAVEWHAASTIEGNKIGSNQLLVHEILKDATKRGIQIYDFNPSAARKGVVEFKEKFGSIKRDCPVIKSYDIMQRLYLHYTSIR